jgi:hypothetical protein
MTAAPHFRQRHEYRKMDACYALARAASARPWWGCRSVRYRLEHELQGLPGQAVTGARHLAAGVPGQAAGGCASGVRDAARATARSMEPWVPAPWSDAGRSPAPERRRIDGRPVRSTLRRAPWDTSRPPSASPRIAGRSCPGLRADPGPGTGATWSPDQMGHDVAPAHGADLCPLPALSLPFQLTGHLREADQSTDMPTTDRYQAFQKPPRVGSTINGRL